MAIVKYPPVLMFDVYSGANSFEHLTRAVNNFVTGMNVFQTAFVAQDEKNWKKDFGLDKEVQLLARPSARGKESQTKIDMMATQLTNLILI